jgi:5-methyltetrahydropteroyltriglutamate--homocysteine methyltransferase
VPHRHIPIATLGTPRIGLRRELKFALESYWSGQSDAASLSRTAAGLRAANWARQKARGVDIIPSNDFSLYDHVLDTSFMVGAIPAAYGGAVTLDTYFAMARGRESSGAHEGVCAHGHAHGQDGGLPAQEMTKWFDTNYHYTVPEFAPGQNFRLTAFKPLDEFLEAKALGYHTRPVLLGPVTFLRLGKPQPGAPEGFDPLSLIDDLVPVYADILRRLRDAGADWVQIDEPVLALDADIAIAAALRRTYARLAGDVPGLKIMLAAYFGGLEDNLDLAVSLPVAGLHVDLVRAPAQLPEVLDKAPADLVLSLGVIDGRNIWRADLHALLDRLAPGIGDREVQLAPSCSLLHVPVDLDLEDALDADVRSWLAFSLQKMDELKILAVALGGGREAAAGPLAASAAAAAARRASPKVHNPAVAARLAAVTVDDSRRHSPFGTRAEIQRSRFNLPAFPTTSIGSFPQTKDVRQARSSHAKGQLDGAGYETFLREETARAIRWQEEIGLDVLVHGEFERNDMVQYFGERLSGFAFTKHAWVQSYGSRYVRPPVLFGDVSRPEPMTVEWWKYSQSLTNKPVKGMLTGPVTLLNWSFVRDDVPREVVCRQIALAIRDEVLDLESAGAAMIQIDEAALREGLPLRRRDWDAYLGWAVDCFRLCAAGVADATQIHTHMCYSEFNAIMDAVAAMDADVISIETSRSKMELLDAFRTRTYPNDIGPGVYDIHSPRVPEIGEMVELLSLARQRLGDDQLWVNPDCGLKTRTWQEVRPALVNMVAAARRLRETV